MSDPQMTTSIQDLKGGGGNSGHIQQQPMTMPQQVQVPQQHIQQQQHMSQQQPMHMQQQPMYNNNFAPSETQFQSVFKPTFDPSMDTSSIYLKDSGVLFAMSVLLFSTPIQDILSKTVPSLANPQSNSVNIVGIIFLSFFLSIFFSVYKLYG